jgi:glycosyltransferase involved in cell wall biosynthesis
VRVGFELTGLELDRTGSARYALALKAELERRSDVEVVALGQPGRGGRLRRGLGRELTYLPFRLPRRAASLGLDLLHCAMPLAPLRSPVPLVVTLHDALAWDHPEWLTRANALQQRLILGRALRGADLVLTGSEFSRQRIAAAVGMGPERIAVTPLGVDRRFSPGKPQEAALERLGATPPYVLCVATLQPRKNLESALAGFERLGESGATDLSLVIAGARGWSDKALLSRLQASTVSGRVVATGGVEAGDLVELYRGAACFLYPSRYEGFGLPVLEAMACGTPVVCSNASSLPEVAGGAALLVQADDVDAIAAALRRALQPGAERDRMVDEGLARARMATWERCAEQTVAAYRLAVESRWGRSASTTRQ